MAASKALEEGFARYNQGRFAQALSLFKSCLEPGTAQPELRRFIAHCLDSLGRNSEAVRMLRGVVRKSPAHLPAFMELAAILREEGRFGQAEAVLRAAPADVSVNGAIAEIIRYGALACRDAEDTRGERDHWQRLLALEPGNKEAARELGRADLKLARRRRESKLAPDLGGIELRRRLERTASARGIAAAVEEAEALPATAERAYWIGDGPLAWSLCRQKYLRSLLSPPKSGRRGNPRGPMIGLQQNIRREKPDDVLEEFSRRIGRSKGIEAARWRVHRGEILLWLGRYADALEDISAGLPFPILRWPPVGIGAARMLQGDFPGALPFFEKAAKTGVPEAVWKPWRGETLRQMGRHREALRDLAGLVKDPDFKPAAWINLALCSAALGRRERVRGVFGILLRRCPFFMAASLVQAGFGDLRGFAGLADEELELSLLKSLELMRGNRSNRLFTFRPDGRELRMILVSPEP